MKAFVNFTAGICSEALMLKCDKSEFWFVLVTAGNDIQIWYYTYYVPVNGSRREHYDTGGDF